MTGRVPGRLCVIDTWIAILMHWDSVGVPFYLYLHQLYIQINKPPFLVNSQFQTQKYLTCQPYKIHIDLKYGEV